MIEWLDGFEHIDAGPDGGTFVANALGWRGVIHMTEGSSLDGAVSAYRSKGVPPHCTADVKAKRRAQHIPLSHSAYALKNLPGGVETNRVHCFQIEIVGFSAHSQELSAAELEWLGRFVFRPIVQALPIRQGHPPFVGQDAGYTIASAKAPQRLNFQQWLVFNGWCGHQHVPENDHWDPGKLDVEAIFKFAYDSYTPLNHNVNTIIEEEDMAIAGAVRRGNTGPLYAVTPDRGGRRSLAVMMGSPEQLYRLMDQGLVKHQNHVELPEAEFDAVYGKPDELG